MRGSTRYHVEMNQHRRDSAFRAVSVLREQGILVAQAVPGLGIFRRTPRPAVYIHLQVVYDMDIGGGILAVLQ